MRFVLAILACVLLAGSASAQFTLERPLFTLEQPAPEPPRPHVPPPHTTTERLTLVYVKTRNCRGCIDGERWLRSSWVPSSWKIGGGPNDQIFIVEDSGDVWRDQHGIEAYPTWLLFRGRKVIGRVDPDAEGWSAKRFIELGLTLYNCHFDGGAPKSKPVLPKHRRGQATYPLRGDWWTGCNSWRHMASGVHAGKFAASWLQRLSWPELQSLHSDDHEHRIQWAYITR